MVFPLPSVDCAVFMLDCVSGLVCSRFRFVLLFD